MKLTRGGLVERRSMVGVSCHALAATKDHGAVVRPSQLIASVRQTWTGVRDKTRHVVQARVRL